MKSTLYFVYVPGIWKRAKNMKRKKNEINLRHFAEKGKWKKRKSICKFVHFYLSVYARYRCFDILIISIAGFWLSSIAVRTLPEIMARFYEWVFGDFHHWLPGTVPGIKSKKYRISLWVERPRWNIRDGVSYLDTLSIPTPVDKTKIKQN